MYNFDKWKFPLKFGKMYLEPSKDYIVTVETHDGSMIPVEYASNVEYLDKVEVISYSEKLFDDRCKVLAGAYQLRNYIDVTTAVSNIGDFISYKFGSASNVNVDNWKSFPIPTRIRISVRQEYSTRSDSGDWLSRFHRTVTSVVWGIGALVDINSHIPLGLVRLLVRIEVFGVKPNLLLDCWAKITKSPRTPKWYTHVCDIKPHTILKTVQQLIIDQELSK